MHEFYACMRLDFVEVFMEVLSLVSDLVYEDKSSSMLKNSRPGKKEKKKKNYIDLIHFLRYTCTW